MEPIFRKKYFLTAGDCNPTAHLPLAGMLRAVIETASLHANRLGIGFENLMPMGIGWVLSRLSLRMLRWPGANDEYQLTTWGDNWNRMFTDRCFVVTDGKGEVLGHIRTTWVCIDFRTRQMADMTALSGERFIAPEHPECPVPRLRNLPVVEYGEASLSDDHRFTYSDLDFNGHVNSARYAECIVNLWPPEVHKALMVTEFDILYRHECRYGQRATLLARETPAEDGGAMTTDVSLSRDGECAVSARLHFRHRAGQDSKTCPGASVVLDRLNPPG